MVINPLISPQPLISEGESRGLKFARVHVYVSVCVFCVCLISSIELHQLFNTTGSAIMFTHPAIHKACFCKVRALCEVHYFGFTFNYLLLLLRLTFYKYLNTTATHIKE